MSLHWHIISSLVTFYFFGCAMRLAGSWFPAQGLNWGPGQWNHWVLTRGPPENSLWWDFSIALFGYFLNWVIFFLLLSFKSSYVFWIMVLSHMPICKYLLANWSFPFYSLNNIFCRVEGLYTPVMEVWRLKHRIAREASEVLSFKISILIKFFFHGSCFWCILKIKVKEIFY